MAGDWIKMRVGLTTNPRVMRIAECLLEDARFLGWSGLSYGVPGYPPAPESQDRAERHAALRVTRYVTVTALLKFWGYANEHVKGEFIAGIFPEDVDEIVGVPGFADAIHAAGWVEFDPAGGLSMPNFGEHNVSAGERSSGAERQKRYREKHKVADAPSDVTRDVTVTPREEKRREEKEQEQASEISIPLDDGSEHPVTQTEVAEYRAAYPRIDVMAEIRKARAWCVSNPANRKTRRGVGKFVNGWLSRADADAAKRAPQPAKLRSRL